MLSRLTGIPDDGVILLRTLNLVDANLLPNPCQSNLLVRIVQNALVQGKATIGEVHHQITGPSLGIELIRLKLVVTVEDHGPHNDMPWR